MCTMLPDLWHRRIDFESYVSICDDVGLDGMAHSDRTFWDVVSCISFERYASTSDAAVRVGLHIRRCSARWQS